jgi:hypothetical protein
MESDVPPILSHALGHYLFSAPTFSSNLPYLLGYFDITHSGDVEDQKEYPA